MLTMAYKRIMLKLSGETFSKEGKGQGLNQSRLHAIAEKVKRIADTGVQVVIVSGGGNFWRYRDQKESGIERSASDYMGMLATILNGVALQAALEGLGADTRVLSAIQIPQVAEPFIRRRAMRHLEKGRIVICAGGTGNPFFTTDSAAALRAAELNCDVLIKATNVDGIYDKDPNEHNDATLLTNLTYQEALEQHLNIMDQAAFSLCQDQKLPIRVVNVDGDDAIVRAVQGKDVGTLVHE
ncbi:UMP kinase [Candidatus Peregrinibacteria bacterium CG10_big_fil_rev_8_21_14_0_10_49_16]|nr:MAG: UMP kinase [Candidatus Peregrinibacteria bacterium CG22_combo_CG10-13_8_21_14_all_49_11]PIR52493.1 MAG: UMP kinase [Candidatus Peregrinibacteria bacterium CG10_big_fil_rev_8_21_14_0_10_49_16]